MTKKKHSAKARQLKTKSKEQSSPDSPILKWLPVVLIIIGLLIFYQSLDNGFVNYDDPDYVLENPHVNGAKDALSVFGEASAGNYHPVTILSLRFNYALSGEEANSFHLLNLILHLLNSLLVFFFFSRFSRLNGIPAFAIAMLFMIHPMHVEAVAWISSRKDVLYAFFFLLGMISYLFFREGKKPFWIILVYAFFLVSALSKPAAAVFPLVLLLMDLYQAKTITRYDLLSKIPLFILSAGLLLITYSIQEREAIDADGSFLSNASYSGFALFRYILALVVLNKLAVLHPYPPEKVNMLWMLLPFLYLILNYIAYKKGKKAITFGMAFFFVSLLLVLQYVAVGRAIIAERYTYLAYLGPFFILAFNLKEFGKSVVPKLLVAVVIIAFGFLSYKRMDDWKNSRRLWTANIEQYPDDWYSLFARGEAYQTEGFLVEAVADYSKALTLKPDEEKLLLMRGRAFATNREYENAMRDLDQCLSLNADNARAYIARGKVYFETGKLDLAQKDFIKALNYDVGDHILYTNLASVYASQNQLDSAINYYNKALGLNPNYTEAHLNLASALSSLGNTDGAGEALNNYLRSGGVRNARFHYTAFFIKLDSGRYEEALKHAENAIRISGEFPELLGIKALAYLKLGNEKLATETAKSAMLKSTQMNIPYQLPSELQNLIP